MKVRVAREFGWRKSQQVWGSGEGDLRRLIHCGASSAQHAKFDAGRVGRSCRILASQRF
jgi:hypothetical protein